MEKSMTAPLAIIRVGGAPVGKMRNLRLTENVRRGRVAGLGRLTPSELPALEWSGTLNCQFYLINFDETVFENNDIGKAMYRNVQNIEQFVDTLLLQEEGIQIDIMRRVQGSINNNGVIQHELERFATIAGCFIEREGMDISEGQVSGRNADFQYTTPIIFPG